MTRRRWRITLLAAAATFAAIFPITTLLNKDDWLQPAALAICIVAVVGLIMRGLTRSRLVVPLVQAAVVGYVMVAISAWSTFTYGAPTTRTLDLIGEFGHEALETMSRYKAPAPLGEGITFWLVLAVALVAICVDAAAATWRSPAAAGLPLLTAYLITAANGNDALALRFFVVPVALWMAMLHTSARAQFGRWSTTTANDAHGLDVADDDASALRSFSAAAAKLGALAIVVGLLVPAIVPHLPPRYLVDGLGRSSGVGGDGTVGFNDTVDLRRSLLNSDESPVLQYTTTGATTPLRVLATSYYSRGEWVNPGDGGTGEPPPLPPADQRRDYSMTVSDSTLAAPHIAAPYPVLSVAMEGTPWHIDPVTRDVRVGNAVSSYRVTYADLAPTAAVLRDSGTPAASEHLDEDLSMPASLDAPVHQWAQEVVGQADNPLDKAIAIQDHLRNTATYKYTLTLPAAERQSDGSPVDPILTFRRTKQGYCVQFASAMIMLARAEGIPARMAIGFLPGVRSGDHYVVRASDAHAWPELYFEGVGWLRFEPTPSSRSGSVPPYAIIGSDTGPTGVGRTSDVSGTGSTSSNNKPSLEQDDEVITGIPVDSGSFQLLSLRGISLVIAAIVLLLAVFVMPLTAWVARARRRRQAATRQELVEIEWEALTSHLGDLGLSTPTGSTLRVQRERYIRDGALDEPHATAMRRVTATLEQARYDRPERTTPAQAEQLHHDIKAIGRQVSRTRRWPTRLRSFLWPRAGVSVWKAMRLRARRR